MLRAVEIRSKKLVTTIVTLSNEPRPTRYVIPPLALDSWLTVPIEHVVRPLFIAGSIGIGHIANLTPEVKLLERTRTVDRAVDDFHI